MWAAGVNESFETMESASIGRTGASSRNPARTRMEPDTETEVFIDHSFMSALDLNANLLPGKKSDGCRRRGTDRRDSHAGHPRRLGLGAEPPKKKRPEVGAFLMSLRRTRENDLLGGGSRRRRGRRGGRRSGRV